MKALQIESITVSELQQMIVEAVKEATPKATTTPTNLGAEYLTRQQVAKLLGVSLVTIDKWSNQGHLQKYRIGGRMRFKAIEVKAAFESVKNQKYQRI
jgi:excisionase family DNA binding protein